MTKWKLTLGATPLPNKQVHFRVWAPFQESLQLQIEKPKIAPIPMKRMPHGYFEVITDGILPGELYTYLFKDSKKLSDPVSRGLPQGVFGPSLIVDPDAFVWKDQKWEGIAQEELIFYECHVGTFTQEGTFEALINKLSYLKELGITCLELMPVTQFSGKWGWGYDGTSLYAPHSSYGSSKDLKQLINCSHQLGIAVCLDIVYNHFGPEGCFLGEFGPYWTDSYHTPWGKAINYDGPGSDEVRNFFLQNALYWIYEYHIDALRLDALHALYDFSAIPFLSQLSTEIRKLAPKVILIAENDRNDSRLIRPIEQGGSGLQALWNEDFHHSLHTSLTKERESYYQDFHSLQDLVACINKGLVYNGRYSPFRNHSHGNSFEGITPQQLVVFLQNHDQIGNRPQGDRLTSILSFEWNKIAATLLLLSPSLPLLFMGQEYGETAPFQYFVDYQDNHLLQDVIKGRQQEFKMQNTANPDQQAFQRSHLNWYNQDLRLLALYKALIKLRKQEPLFRTLKYSQVHATHQSDLLIIDYNKTMSLLCYFGSEPITYPIAASKILLHTDQHEFGGTNALHLDTHNPIIYLPGPVATLFSHLGSG